MKVAIAGPSGTGKTTIAEYIASTMELRHITSKETRHVPTEVQKEWANRYMYFGDIGHRRLINLQNAEPAFGRSWQMEMLIARGKVIRESDNFIMDRSPIDSLTYMLCQNAHNLEQHKDYFDEFVNEVRAQLKELTHVIFMPYNNPDWVEENGSRVASIPFQKLMSSSFEHIIDEYLLLQLYKVQCMDRVIVNGRMPWKTGLLTLTMWDLETRKDLVKDFLTRYHE